MRASIVFLLVLLGASALAPLPAAATLSSIDVTLDRATAWRTRIRADGTFRGVGGPFDMTKILVTVSDARDLNEPGTFTSCREFPSGTVRCQNDDRTSLLRFIPDRTDPDLYRYRLDYRRRNITRPQVPPAQIEFVYDGTLRAAAKNEPCRLFNSKLVCKGESIACTAEVCDGLDNDCDGSVDEDLGQTSCGIGACANTIDSCVGGVTQTCDPSATDGGTCDDADACTTDDRCAAGSCAGGPPPNCDDSNECTDDSCSSATGCVNDYNTSPCTDTNTNDCFAAVCNAGACDQSGGFEAANTACGSQSDTDCDAPNTCNSTGTCLENNDADGTTCASDGIACTSDVCAGGVCTHPPAAVDTPCTGAANGGLCDDDAADRCDASGACIDGFRPSTHACSLERDPVTGNYACTEVSYCTGTASGCPIGEIQVFDNTIPCRETRFGGDPICDPPEYCSGYGVCPPNQQVDATCEGGPREGAWCDHFAEVELGQPQCGDGGTCVRTVCVPGTMCEEPWTCTPSGSCEPNGFLPEGADCIGDLACERSSCDASGNCVSQNVPRSPTARCRKAANECDVADFCGDPSTVPSNGRYDFDDYPDCGPDEKQPWMTECTFDLFGQDARGTCMEGECHPFYCRNSIECEDGWVCGCPPGQVCERPYCIPAPTEGGYGDVCTVKGRCNISSEVPGRVCTSRTECDPGNNRPDAHCFQRYCDLLSTRPGIGCDSDAVCQVGGANPSGKCTSLQSPERAPAQADDCGPIPNSTRLYVCCAGMQGDGIGATPLLGQTGRCQQCCNSDVGGACSGLTPETDCCDGKCTNVATDPNNCIACNYEPNGVDCDNVISACSPGVVSCDAANIGSGCVMEEYCDDAANQNGWTAAYCDIPQQQFAVPGCDYCVLPSTNPGSPCVTDDDCEGPTFDGVCFHEPDLFCFAERTFARGTSAECSEAPYTDCAPSCSEIDTSNVGDICNRDEDCRGGTTCKTACDFSGGIFCFGNNVCQW